MTSPTRLPNVHSLTHILPKGAESGKEFARVVDLLLFQEARRQGRSITLLNDTSGDYRGLDSFEADGKGIGVGYQYKFFSSPLSDDHRTSITAALKKVAAIKKGERPKKWILVTPDDLTNSGRRAGGGDVQWLEDLRTSHARKITIEHYGHTKLISLFLDTPSLCLFYYPELVKEGTRRRRSIQDTRTTYDENLRLLFGRIEFVGMSVLKEEASRRVELEHIYIPVGLVSSQTEAEAETTPRLNPTELLAPGRRAVILGDPGSGKSTLVRFLALCGTSPRLQQRYATAPDARIPLVVTLRRYADELKQHPNLPLFEYLKGLLQADFSLPDIDDDFLNYYLESGQAILLFDGLDELPNSSFRVTVRDRIQTLSNTYPRNTVIVTSRIVGYDPETQFNTEDFLHFRVAKLRFPEIEQFINDWYTVRLESSIERAKNAQDLIRIIKQAGNEAIRDLARNPLLLTIVALVHRIDAVLPDERVVLYQKCTETLLNTWHQSKYRQDEERAKVRIERRNRHRIEAIACWMHRRNTGSREERAIVSFEDLLNFLTNYIESNETNRGIEPAEDQAEEFLDFIRKRAGLIIEAGDGFYSFVHLTFQEYLTATHLITQSEKDGLSSVWKTIGDQIGEPRWHEVIRLLVASLRSDEGQRYLIDQLITAKGTPAKSRDILLTGLLVDGIGPAEEREAEILQRAIEFVRKAKASKDFLDIVGLVRERHERITGAWA
ncbi:NACHT domain-containing protein [Bradyrhizobium quebecense]|uniref:NACHT domain-containing protein n=2 Tax=Bradyrhizobium quebecense TaxID=2748629 RepID=A0ABS3MDK1_9BRAD|nr:NACHT domain-containing protein [Bradyrhizobium quebecense]UGY04848.1 NACHT domain-containing protein [Bradyrhizobium quebecense]